MQRENATNAAASAPSHVDAIAFLRNYTQYTPSSSTLHNQTIINPIEASSVTSSPASSIIDSTTYEHHAPPTSFASSSHDEFSKVNTKNSPSGRFPASAASGTNNASRHTIYRSPLTARPLVRTLNVILQALASTPGQPILIELKNETFVRGALQSVDPGGNMLLEQVRTERSPGSFSTYSPKSIQRQFDSLFIPARSVRYVHIPDRIDVKSLLTKFEVEADERLLQYKRKKRSGKFITREEQERQIDIKQEKLRKEMEALEQQQQQQSVTPSDSAGDETSGEPTNKKPKL